MKGPLREVFDFKRDELPVVALLFTFFFLTIAVFQILRPLKKGLFLEYYGADVELYAKLANILLAGLAVTLFTYLYNRLSRERLLYVFCLFFIVSFLAVASGSASPGAGLIWSFYFLGDIESTLMVAAFFAYLTDISTMDQSKRLYGVIGGGGVIGGWVGATSATTLLQSIGMQGLLVLAATFMGIILIVVYSTELVVKSSPSFRISNGQKSSKAAETEKSSKLGAALEGARLVTQSKYLLAIVGIMGFYEMASQVMDYQFATSTEPLSGVITTQQFVANVNFFANVAAVVVQFFLVSLIMKRFGIVVALLVLPVAVTCSSLAFFAVPTMYVASLLQISDNGLNYSIQQTTRETLYVVTTPDEKYKARAFTSMFVQRLAKGLSILNVLGLGLLKVPVRYLSVITVAVAVLMIACSVYAGRTFNRKSGLEEQELRVA